MMFCITVLREKMLNLWNTMPTCMRKACSFLVSIRSPLKKTSPSSKVSSQLMQRSRVLLPEPEGPSITVCSPFCMEKDRPLGTVLSPKLFLIFLTSGIGTAIYPSLLSSQFESAMHSVVITRYRIATTIYTSK